jgi:hypothetical protein
MANIDYTGIDPSSIELVNSEEFRAALTAYPNLSLVTVDEDEDDNEIFNEVVLPLSEGTDVCLAVMDSDDEDAFMWVLYDNYESVYDPSPAFIEILRVMDVFSHKTLNQRLFISMSRELYRDSPEALAAEFDFTKGDYVILS